MRNKGFTLIELLVVIAIVGLLASIVLVSTQGLKQKAKITKTLEFSQSLNNSLGAYAVGRWDFDEGSGITARDGAPATTTTAHAPALPAPHIIQILLMRQSAGERANGP